ncbi:MAG: Ig-like domain-containing protein [Luteolibacter sp.]|uniref:DUF7933 domain-containing protein n=1 Tax=Luteolibacter sp. TaxID=1962973 RepID=UPI003266C383
MHTARAAILLLLGLSSGLSADPVITATKDDGVAAATRKPGGSTVTYTNTITNAGPGTATGLEFKDPDIAHALLVPGSVNVSPLALDDAFVAVANTQLVVGNATALSGPALVVAGNVLSNDTEFLGDTFSISVFDATSLQGGTVNLVTSGVNAGSFTFVPGAGDTGVDSFTYTIRDKGADGIANNADDLTGVGKVTITIGTQKVWYVDSSYAGANGASDGRSSQPFTSLTATNVNGAAGAGDVDGPNDIIYIRTGTYAGGIVLEAGQTLWGENEALVVDTFSLNAVGTDPILANAGGAGVTLSTGNTLKGLTIGNTSSSSYDIDGTAVGALTVSNLACSGTGGFIRISTSGALNVTLDSAVTTGAPSAISLKAATGTFSVTTGSITGATGDDIFIDGGTANISYGGTITNSTFRSVSIANKTAGAVTFSGQITDNAGSTGILLSANTGATVDFTGGLALTTTTNNAFTATGGGTITATQNNGSIVNTITATTGMALNVQNTTIGAAGLIFRSITSGTGAGSAGSGIILDSTGAGSFTVAGNGGAATGGTLQHKTGADGGNTGIGIYLNNVASVSLSRMQLNDFDNFAIRGITVGGFSMNNCTISSNAAGNSWNGSNAAGGFNEGSVSFSNLTGAATISNSSISGGFSDNFRVVNTTGTLNRLTFDAVTIGANSNGVAVDGSQDQGNDGITIEPQSGAIINVTVQNSIFTSARGDLFQLNNIGTAASDLIFTGNTLSNNYTRIATGGGGVSVFTNGTGNLTFNMSGNTFRNAVGAAVLFVKSTGVATLAGTFSGNTIGVQGTANSGSSEGSALKIQSAGGGTVTTLVTNNLIYQYNNFGIEMLTGGGATPQSGNFNSTITGNTISNPGTNPAAAAIAKNGIHLNGGTVPLDTFQIALDIGGAGVLANSLSNSGAPNDAAAGGEDIRLRQRQDTTVRLRGYTSTPADNAAVQTYAIGRNGGDGAPSAIASNQVTTASDGFFNTSPAGSAVPQPLLFAQGGIDRVVTSATVSIEAVVPVGETGLASAMVDSSLPQGRSVSATAEQGISSETALSQEQLDLVVSTAINRWELTGLSEDQAARLRSLKFEVSQLPNGYLGEAGGNNIRVDRNAGGAGWYMDASTASDALFGTATSDTRHYTDPTSSAAGRVDLLTTILHEMGHSLGLPDTYRVEDRNSIMFGQLTTGERRIPSMDQAKDAVPFTGSHAHFLSGGLNPITIGVLPAGKSVIITYKVDIENPVTGGATQISSQGTVHSTTASFTDVLTDDTHPNDPADPVLAGVADPTVTLLAVPPSVTTQPTNQVVNLGNVATFTAAASGAPTPTVQWQISTNGGGAFSDIVGATSTTLSFTPIAGDNGKQYRAVFTNSVSTATSNAATLTVVTPPVIAANFGVATIPLNGTTSLTFTLTNNNPATALTVASFTDTLPAGLVVATPNGLSGGTGGGTLTAVAGATSISLSGTTIPAAGSVTFSVDVTGTSAGLKNNSVQITSAEGSGNTSNASLTVVAPPLISQAFGVGSVAMNGTTTLTFNVSNPNTSTSLTGVGFTETLPAGLVVATPNGLSGSLGGGTITAVAGSSSVSLTGATLAASGSGSFSINVTGTTAGTKSATTGNITSTEGGTGGNASASLGVVAPPVMGIAFNPVAVNLNGISTLTYTITNPAGNPATLSGVSFMNTLPAGLVVATPNGLSSTAGGTTTAVAGSGSVSLSGGSILANSSATISVNVTSGTANTYNNSVAVSSTNGGTGNTANASLLVRPPVDHFAITSVPATATAGSAFNITVTAQDPANATVTGYAGTVHFTSSDAAVVLPADATLINGTGTFSVTLKTSGNQTVSATDTVTPSATGTSSNITVNPAAVHHFAVSSPATATAGTPISVGVTAQDQFNNTVTTYSGTAHLTSTDGVAILPADSTLVSGFKSLSVNFSTGGNQTVTATDTVTASITGTSTGIVVAPQADLAVTMTDSPDPVSAAGNLTYLVTLTNNGPSTAVSPSVSLPTPASTTFLSAVPSAGTAGGPSVGSSGTVIFTPGNLGSGASATMTVTVKVDSNFANNTVISATATATASTGDPNGANNSATATTTLVLSADLSITKTDGVTTATSGGSVTYTITASNAGPSNITGATVADVLPASLTPNWTGVGAGGGTGPASGSGNINANNINLPAGGSFTFTVSATISASATGSLSNTATIAAPAGVNDPTPGNNSATDTDTLIQSADLSITKTDGVVSATPGGSVTYTITASNAGPSNVTAATVADSLPASITGATWTGVGASGGTGPANGSGNINATNLSLPAGGSFTFTVTAPIAPAATGTLSNTATVSAPAGVTDPTPGNNSATDSDTLAPSADVSVTVTDSPDPVVAGNNLTYTVTVANSGPSFAASVSLNDTLPAGATFVSLTSPGGWSSTTPAVGGTGTVSSTNASLAPGSVSFTLVVKVGSGVAPGTVISDTATVSSVSIDPTPGNNSSTATTTVSAQADLSITKTDGVTAATPGTSVTYTITAANAGPSDVIGATVADTFPAVVSGATWTGAGAGGATGPASGSGNINVNTVNLPAGGSFTFTVTAPIAAAATGTVSNTATVAAPAGVTDPTPGNNSATDTDTLAPSADVSVTVTDSPDPVNAGNNLSYTITVSNNGPSSAASVSLSNAVPPGTTFVSLTSPGGWSSTTPAVGGTGAVSSTIASLVPGTATFTLVVNVGNALPLGMVLSDTATVSSTTADPTPANNSGLATTTVTAESDLAVTVTDSPDPVIAGNNLTYTITVTNNGPSGATSVVLNDVLPAGTTFVSLTSPANWSSTTPPVGGTGTVSSSFVLLAPLPPGTVTFTLVVKVGSAVPAGTVLSDTASVSSGTTDPTPANNSGTATTTVSAQADLAITITDSPDPVNAAGNLTYTINLTNNGPSTAVSPSVSLPLPPSTTFVSATAPGAWVTTAPLAGGVGTVNFSDVSLATGGSATFTVVVKVDLAVVNNSILTATATATTTTTDPNPGNNSAIATTTAKSGADLQITLSDSPDPVIAGTELTYTLQLQNNGPLDADNVSITDTLPAGTSFVSLSAPSGWSATTPAVGATGQITLTNPLVANGGAATFTVVVKVGAGVPNGFIISNTASATSTVIDIAPANNSSTATSTVTTSSDLAVEITGTPATVPKGSNVSFAIKLTNNGPSNADATTLTIPLPSQMTFVSSSIPSGWFKTTPAVGSGGNVVFSTGALANGNSTEFTVVVKVKPTVATGKIITTTATVSSITGDPVAGNDSSSSTVAVGTVTPTVVQPVTTGIEVNSQNGLFDVVVNVTNTTPAPINGFRLHVDFKAYKAAYPSLRLYNSSSAPGSSDVYVDYPYPVAINGKVPVKLSFYTSTRTFPSPFAPILTVETLQSSQVSDTDGSGVQPRLVRLPDKTVLLEFPSVVGHWYRVRYSADMIHWSDCPVPLQAGTTRMQWIDSGPPFTNVSPANTPSRFYRVNEIPNP